VAEAHDRPSILAGGLTPENVAAAIAAVAPYAVDVISSVEDPGHRKVRHRVRAFIHSATMTA
jgi:phosphoribosylanthranilate isomerase